MEACGGKKAPLGKKGYEVVASYDGDEGLRKVVEERPDLIILDVIMPVKDGFAACRELKTDNRYYFFSHTVLLSAYLQKPFDPQELLSRVEELLKRQKG